MKTSSALLGLAIAATFSGGAYAQSGVLRPLDINAASQIAPGGTAAAAAAIPGAPMAITPQASKSYQPVPISPLRPMSAVTPASAAARARATPAPRSQVASASPALQPMPSMQPLKPLHVEAMPSPATVTGATFPVTSALPAGDRLSTALERYVRERGWDIRWQIEEDYVLDASLPIPSSDLIEAVTWVVHTYQSQGGMLGVVPRFARTNRVVVIEKMNVRDQF